MNEEVKSVIRDPEKEAISLRQMLDHTDAHIAYLDLDFNFIDVNQAYMDGSGKLYDELIGNNHFDLFPDEENNTLFKMVRDSGKPIEFHAKPFIFPCQPERGTTYWDWILKPVKNRNDEVEGFVLSLKEVTDRYKIWKQSRKSALKLMLIMTMTIFLADSLIMLIFKFIDAPVSQEIMFFDPLLLTCFLIPILYFFFLKPIITNLSNTKQSKKLLLTAYGQLESERGRLFSILDELPASVHLLRPDHSILYANRYFKENFGGELNKPCYKILHGREVACTTCHAFEIFENKQGHQTEEIHADGRLYQIYNYPFVDIDGSKLVLQLGIDLTKQKEYEKRLIQTERLHMVAEMTAMISHEFRNSLTSVKMILELLTESRNLDGNEKQSLAVVLSSIKHMEEIVTQLLNFSQPRSLDFKPVDLNGIIEASLDFTQAHLKKNSIQIEKNLSPEIPVLFIDRHHFKEMIVNLILNAVHAIAAKDEDGQNGKVGLKTELCRIPDNLDLEQNGNPLDQPDAFSSDLHEERSVLKRGDKCVLISVCDNGIGIRESEIEHIFNPFYTEKTQGGTGLGLAMVKRTVNAHKGLIRAESQPGHGTVFKLYLPLQNEK